MRGWLRATRDDPRSSPPGEEGDLMTQPASSTSERAVAPFILDDVGDVARPRGMVRARPDLRHLPGEAGIVAGLRAVVAPSRRGADYYVELQQRYGRVFRS